MPETQAFIGGHWYNIAAENLVPRGKRGYIRKTRSVQSDEDIVVPKTATWKLSGPVGQSWERQDGFLGPDHGTLETRYDDLLTSLGAVSTLTVSSSDPLASGTAALGGIPLGGRALGGGSSLGTPTNITHIKENSSQLFLARGGFVTQVNPSTWAVVATKTLAAAVRGMANWFGKLRLGMGAQLAIQTVTGITSSAVATFSNTQVSASDTFGKEMETGNDRLWWVRADAAGTNENRIRFTQDDFSSQSTGFIVGDPGVNATAVGVMGPYTTVGSETGIFSFTDAGTPFNLVRALQDARSQDNGRKSAYQWGWEYRTTSLGLYAMRPGVANPIGIGTEAMSGFEGFDGKPVAVLAWRESLFVAYEDSAATTWRILRGVFNARTDATGEFDLYPFASRTNAAVRCMGATSTPTLPTIVWGEGANTLARIAQGRAGRDISDASYTYSVAGGQWFGSTMMRNNHLRKTVRWGRFFTESMESGDSFTLAIAFDGGSYTNIGSAVTADGAQKVVPGTLTSAPSGFTPKPRITQVAGGASSSTSPPQLRGFLEIGYDERPDKVIECAFVFHLTSKIEQTRLEALDDATDSSGRQPVEIRLPGDSTLRYGYVKAVEEQDLTDATVLGASVIVTLVEAS